VPSASAISKPPPCTFCASWKARMRLAAVASASRCTSGSASCACRISSTPIASAAIDGASCQSKRRV
jgi:hypothetical protein